MDASRFDDLTRHFSRTAVGRRSFLAGALGLGAGAAAVAKNTVAQDPTQTPADFASQQDDTTLETQFPCPVPGGPSDWLCGTGPWGPWYPMIAPPELTAATGIRWHGVAPADTGGLEAKAFTQAGQEISDYRSEVSGDFLRWSLGDSNSSIDGFLKLPDMVGDETTLEFQINGISIPVEISDDGLEPPAENLVFDLDPRQRLLFEQWQPAAERLDGLLQLGLRSPEDPLEGSSTGCAVAGFVLGVSWVGCLAGPLGCLPAAGATSYIANKCTDSW